MREWNPVSLVSWASESAVILMAVAFLNMLAAGYTRTAMSVGFQPLAASTSHGQAVLTHTKSSSARSST